MKQIFIDKFSVPPNAADEFYQRMSYNRNFIKNLPGLINDGAYQRTDENGNLIVITVAVWENEDVFIKAKEAVQAEYKRIGFDTAEMFARLDIKADRGVYTEIGK